MQYSEMAAELSAEQRRLIEDYLVKSWPKEGDAADLWASVLGAHCAGAASRAIDIIAGTHGVDERMVRALFAGAELIADVGGYTSLMGSDEEGTLAQLKAHRRELVDPKITAHRARTVKYHPAVVHPA
jgi:hypothetical protein